MHLKFWEKKKNEDYFAKARTLIRVGDTGKFTVTEGKIKNGYNSSQDKFYIQITDNRNLEAMRIYMDKEFFRNFHYNMGKTAGFIANPDSFLNSPGNDPATHHSYKENNPVNP